MAHAVVALFALCVVALTAGPAAAKYRIGAGDLIEIEVLEDTGLNRQVLVLPDGSISFPLVGTVRAQGRTIEDLRRDLAAGLAPNFAAAPTVSVSVVAIAPEDEDEDEDTIDVYIMGEVLEPGKRETEPGTTILQFLAESGGLSPFAAQSRIELHRVSPSTGTTQIYLFSYNNKLGRNKSPRIASSTRLTEGDVIVVPARKLFE